MLIHAMMGSLMRHGISSHHFYIGQMLSPSIPLLGQTKTQFSALAGVARLVGASSHTPKGRKLFHVLSHINVSPFPSLSSMEKNKQTKNPNNFQNFHAEILILLTQGIFLVVMMGAKGLTGM